MTILINKGQSNTFALDNLDNKALTVGFSYVFEYINGQSKQSQKLTIAPTTTSNVSEFVLAMQAIDAAKVTTEVEPSE